MANSAENPKLGVNSVIFSPTVLITFLPKTIRPKTIPVAPINSTHGLTADLALIVPSN